MKPRRGDDVASVNAPGPDGRRVAASFTISRRTLEPLRPRHHIVQAVSFAVMLLMLIAVPVIYGSAYPLSIASVFEDVVTYGKLAPLVGFMSDLGIAMWIATAILLLHGLHRVLQHHAPLSSGDYGFYVFWILALLLLALDDRLLIHEWLTERWQIPEGLIMGLYGVILGAGAWRSRAYVKGRPMGWLWLAFLMLGTSVGIDLSFGASIGASAMVLEEAAKWLGICALFLYVFGLMTDPPISRVVSHPD